MGDDKSDSFVPPGKKEPGRIVAEHQHRALVDDLLLKGMPPARIVRYLQAIHGVTFAERSVAAYRDNFFRGDKGIVYQIVKASQDLADKEPPATSDRELLSSYFSMSRTNRDIKMFYDRIEVLRGLAEKYPFDSSYDERIAEAMTKIESIRTRVFRHQYDQLRKGIILNIGKKICLAAINVFLPYVAAEKRKESVSRFEAIIKPMLGLAEDPDKPIVNTTVEAPKPEDGGDAPAGS